MTIDNKSPLVQVMVRCHNKPLPELIMTKYLMLFIITGTLLGLILGLRPANERRRYFVTTSLIGWAQR